jgi:Cu2+-exporting ATPase
MIHESGLERFYVQRQRPAAKATSAAAEDWSIYDRPALRQGWVRRDENGGGEAVLALEGMVCGACAWLNEQHLQRLPGVIEVQVNFAAQRLRVRWREPNFQVSQVFAAVAALGYRAVPFDAEALEIRQRAARRALLWRLGVAGFGMMQVMMYAFPAYLTGESLGSDASALLRWASLVLSLPVLLFSASPFFSGAWRDLAHRRVGMDVPVTLALLIAFVASAHATIGGQGEVYFDALTMFVFLLLGSRYFELRARQQAIAGLHLAARPLPAMCIKLTGVAGAARSERVAVAELAVGDVVLVAAGEVIPADGQIVGGDTRVEEAQLTGEFWPVTKGPGAAVYAGSLNRQGPITVRLAAVGANTRLWAIGHLVDRALAARPRLALLADRVAGRFVLVQMGLAALVGLFWLYVDPARALVIVVAVLVVSCPCALSLAAPMALAVANGALARLGLLITSAQAMETLARATDVVFDKTGTLTTGRPVIRQLLVLGELPPALLRTIAASLELASRHPLAEAFRQNDVTAAGAAEEVAGCGVAGEFEGVVYRLGRAEWVAELVGKPIPPSLCAPATTANLVALGCAKAWLAGFILDDAPRAQAAETVASLQGAGLKLHLLSGDRPEAVSAWAEGLGMETARGGASPEDKQAFVEGLQRRGAIVVMVGDGVNDTPGFAQAQAAVALGSGSALARARADMVLLGESLLPLARGVAAARRCLGVLRQNLVWGFAYNVLMIPLAAAGWVNPWIAAGGMALSSMIVVLNAGRLARDDVAWKSSTS